MFHQPLNSRVRRQPLPFLFAMVLGDSLLLGSVGALSQSAAAQQSVEKMKAL